LKSTGVVAQSLLSETMSKRKLMSLHGSKLKKHLHHSSRSVLAIAQDLSLMIQQDSAEVPSML